MELQGGHRSRCNTDTAQLAFAERKKKEERGREEKEKKWKLFMVEICAMRTGRALPSIVKSQQFLFPLQSSLSEALPLPFFLTPPLGVAMLPLFGI